MGARDETCKNCEMILERLEQWNDWRILGMNGTWNQFFKETWTMMLLTFFLTIFLKLHPLDKNFRLDSGNNLRS